jgi:hypothetical protein
LPFILCGVLAAVYLYSPSEIGPLVRPHERVLYLLIFFLPICCINNKLLNIERIAVILLCGITFFQSYNYFTTYANAVSPSLKAGRALIQKIQKEKK